MRTDQMKKAICAGHICLDLTPVTDVEKEYGNIAEYLTPGSLVPVKQADIHVGGSVGNTGAAMAKLGAQVTLMGKTGNDEFGQLLLKRISGEADCSGMIISDQTSTSYSVILAVPGIDRIILHNSGANDTFSMKDLDFEAIRKVNLFHFGYPTLMKKFYENDGIELVRMLQAVKDCGTATSVDMALTSEDSEAGRADWSKIIKESVPYVDFFMPSAEELAFFIDRPRYSEWKRRADGKDIASVLTKDEVAPMAEKLLSWGAKVVLIKCGSAGMYLRTGDQAAISRIGGGLGNVMSGWHDVEHFELCYKPRRILSGTGAGDTSIAAFLCAVLEGYSWEEAVKLAAATGAVCVEEYDALSGIKPFSVLQNMIAGGWEKAGR